MKKWENKAIEDIMNEFDFEKVHKVMEFLNWKWAYRGVPSVNEIKKEAERIMKESCNEDRCYAATGGFWVFRRREEHQLFLMFAIEDWHYE